MLRWPDFDGYCASINVDPLTLPFPRLLNLAYYSAIAGITKDAREEIDEALNEMAGIIESARHRRFGAVDDEPWWWNEDEAGAEALALAERLRVGR